ncbi:unnamed protein product, partial [Mesorhabditis spiculigera]
MSLSSATPPTPTALAPPGERLSIVQIEHYAHDWDTSAETDKLFQDDAVWIITSSFIIFTMHSGFGLLESGSVSAKDEVNIMVKNVVDVVFGGVSYWAIGFGLSFGDYEPFRNSIVGFGKFFYDPSRTETSVNVEGWAYASFLFQLSLATTASTIVSGAVAERAKLKSYILLGCLVIIIQALPAHWIWDSKGIFFKLGVIDFAGCSAVHMVGGVIGLMATLYLKPRRNRFSEDAVSQMSSPTNALLGTFLLWWGWFGINAGSVWGITNGRWRLGARSAVATIMASIGGGSTSIMISFAKTKKLQVNFLINGILSSIVSITAMCAVARPWHALFIGSISSAFSILILPVLDRLHIDDPVGIVPIHLTSSIWGMLAVGIFAEQDRFLQSTSNQAGLLYGGGFHLLGIQLLCTVVVVVYSATTGLLALWLIDKSPLGLRVTDYEEQIGADVIEHGLAGTNIARYVVEKPLSTKTFLSVTKAVAKWKMLTKQKNKEKRKAAFLQKKEDGLRQRIVNGHGPRVAPLQRGSSLQLNNLPKPAKIIHNGKPRQSRSQNNSPRDATTPMPTPRGTPGQPTIEEEEPQQGTSFDNAQPPMHKNSHISIPMEPQVDSGLGTEGAESPTHPNDEDGVQTGDEPLSDDAGPPTPSPRNRPPPAGPPRNRPATVTSVRPRFSASLFRRAPLPRPISPPDEVIIETSGRSSTHSTARYVRNNKVVLPLFPAGSWRVLEIIELTFSTTKLPVSAFSFCPIPLREACLDRIHTCLLAFRSALDVYHVLFVYFYI